MSDECNIRKDMRVGGNELYSWNREELRVSLKLLSGGEQWQVKDEWAYLAWLSKATVKR